MDGNIILEVTGVSRNCNAVLSLLETKKCILTCCLPSSIRFLTNVHLVSFCYRTDIMTPDNWVGGQKTQNI